MTEPLDPSLPDLIVRAFAAYGDGRKIEGFVETSAGVSTNRVYRLFLDDRTTLFAKLSSYGSYVHFRQDHQRIQRWIDLLSGGRFESVLAPVLTKNGGVFTHHEGQAWVVFYREAPRRGVLPRVLSDAQIENLAEEIADFHQVCQRAASQLDPTWQTLGADIAQLYDRLQWTDWTERRGMTPDDVSLLREQCDTFLNNADRLGYHSFRKLPVLIDWNRGNFSVEYQENGRFRLYSRWDYDWFRIEPRTMDFYFFSRVVREEGDQTIFSYTVDPLFEPRFRRFLQAYHQVFPMRREEVLFLKEAYRFFVLNYVVRRAPHFFLPEICQRLQREATQRYLPALDAFDFRELVESLGDGTFRK
jgi:Ser/Thr protein kinase RdoA (MazF antagonist)